ncbi:MAG: ATPase central domain protein [Blastococcus sp.]|nr:ATPase central domain protein [Blastococcus sp.]
MSPEVDAVSRHVVTVLTVLERLDAALSAAVDGREPSARTAPRPLLSPDEHPADSRFRHLADAYRLSPVELDLLLLAMAPQLDVRYGELFGCLQGDPARHRPTVSVALGLLGLTPAQRVVARQVLTPTSRLVAPGLVRLHDPSGQPGSPLPDRELSVDDRLVAYVTGHDGMDAALSEVADVVRIAPTGPGIDRLVVADEVRAQLASLQRRPQRLCLLRGPEGSGRQGAAEVLAQAWGVTALLRVQTDRLPFEDPARFAALVQAVSREARLQRAAPFWERFDVLLEEPREPLRDLVQAALSSEPHAFVSASGDWPARNGPALAEVVLTSGTTGQRAELWRRRLDASAPDGATAGGPAAEDLAALAAAFRLGPRAIGAAVAEARNSGAAVTAAALAAAARRQGSAALAGEGRRVEQPYGWNDLVLPPDRLQRLHALGDRIRFRATVYDLWGFAATVGPARGTAALFTGPSGTGKTMAAGILAGSLGLDLYRVDLAGVVSKYIGETEKALARIFAAAEATSAVLFFDEADALFGKRTEVRDAHDRYANVEVSYLLQRLEEHDGVVVLATNLRKNIDEAFLRRLQFVVEFPLPDRDHRRLIWQRMFPAAAPLDPALDLDLLAERFELSGGSIRNVAVEAAFAAAVSGRPIGPDHVSTALRHEHQKLGRVPAEHLWAGSGDGPSSPNGHVPLARSAP